MDRVDLALLILRLAIGLTVAGHGSRLLMGWWGGLGFAKTQGLLVKARIQPAMFWAAVLCAGDLLGGLAFALGFFTPFAAGAIMAVMLVATVTLRFASFWNSQNGWEYQFVLAAAAATVGVAGAGTYSVDAALGISSIETPFVFAIGVAVMLLGALVSLITRRPASAEAAAPTG